MLLPFFGTEAAKSACRRVGEENGRAKLTWASVRVIRDMIGFGWSDREIAGLFDVSYFLIYSIRKQKNWKHPADLADPRQVDAQ